MPEELIGQHCMKLNAQAGYSAVKLSAQQINNNNNMTIISFTTKWSSKEPCTLNLV